MFIMAEEGELKCDFFHGRGRRAKVRCLSWQREAELECDVCHGRGRRS